MTDHQSLNTFSSLFVLDSCVLFACLPSFFFLLFLVYIIHLFMFFFFLVWFSIAAFLLEFRVSISKAFANRVLRADYRGEWNRLRPS